MLDRLDLRQCKRFLKLVFYILTVMLYYVTCMKTYFMLNIFYVERIVLKTKCKETIKRKINGLFLDSRLHKITNSFNGQCIFFALKKLYCETKTCTKNYIIISCAHGWQKNPS